MFDFALRKDLRAQRLQLLERDVAAGSNWIAKAAPPEPPSTPSVNVSASLGGFSVSLGVNGGGGGPPSFASDTTLVPEDVLREERYQVDPNLQEQAPRVVGDPQMARELARVRRRYIEARGKTDSRQLRAGYRFTLARHPVDALNLEYTVTALDAEGLSPDLVKDAGAVYKVAFRCIPSDVMPIPPRPKKRPKLGLEVAQVVAYSDIAKVPFLESSPAGYVKVRFRWDIADSHGTPKEWLVSTTADDAAIWVPVAQPWAGAGYGAQFIPREGMEVLVGFLENQGERPVILGCLYSAANPPPWGDQPGSQKVGIKSQTRAANGGWSEISIDDTQGAEVVALRAQRDLVQTVLADSRISVGGNATEQIDGDNAVAIGGDDSEHVAGDATVLVDGARSVTITGSDASTVGGDAVQRVAGKWRHETTGASAVRVGDASERTVGGTLTERIGKAASYLYAAAVSYVVGHPDAEAARTTYVYGSTSTQTTKDILYESATAISLKCGPTLVKLTPSGLTLNGKLVAIAGSSEVDLASSSSSLTMNGSVSLVGKTASVASSGAKLQLDTGAALKGSTVSLGSGSGGSVTASQSSGASSMDAPVFFRTKVLRQGKVAPGVPYTLQFDDAPPLSGSTTGAGMVEQPLPATASHATLTFTDTGHTRTFEIGSIDPPTSVQGVQHRLQHLGFYHGKLDGHLNELTAHCLQVFQKAKGLPVTGQIDAATIAEVTKEYGS